MFSDSAEKMSDSTNSNATTTTTTTTNTTNATTNNKTSMYTSHGSTDQCGTDGLHTVIEAQWCTADTQRAVAQQCTGRSPEYNVWTASNRKSSSRSSTSSKCSNNTGKYKKYSTVSRSPVSKGCSTHAERSVSRDSFGEPLDLTNGLCVRKVSRMPTTLNLAPQHYAIQSKIQDLDLL